VSSFARITLPTFRERYTVYINSIKEVIRYRWRTLWLGKWSTTRYYTTGEEIRRTHPEAVPVENTRQVLMVAETDEERQGHSTSAFQRDPR